MSANRRQSLQFLLVGTRFERCYNLISVDPTKRHPCSDGCDKTFKTHCIFHRHIGGCHTLEYYKLTTMRNFTIPEHVLMHIPKVRIPSKKWIQEAIRKDLEAQQTSTQAQVEPKPEEKIEVKDESKKVEESEEEAYVIEEDAESWELDDEDDSERTVSADEGSGSEQKLNLPGTSFKQPKTTTKESKKK